jgi:hypothetical protein
MMVEIDQQELDALREQAATAIPWEGEAKRLAAGLCNLNPEHKLLQSDLWQEHFKKELDFLQGSSPDNEAARAIADAAGEKGTPDA